MSEVSTVLKLVDIPTVGWEPLDVGHQLAADYRAVGGWDGAEAPAGLSIVVARLAFTRGGRPIPPGGVLLGIDMVAYCAPPSGGRYEFMASTTITSRHSVRPLVDVVIRLRVPAGRDVAEVAFSLRRSHE